MNRFSKGWLKIDFRIGYGFGAGGERSGSAKKVRISDTTGSLTFDERQLSISGNRQELYHIGEQ
jgi:hypothetical protein